MYNAAELFVMESDPKAVKEIFLNSVTLSVEDDASGCVDLDAEKKGCPPSGNWRTCPCGSW